MYVGTYKLNVILQCIIASIAVYSASVGVQSIRKTNNDRTADERAISTFANRFVSIEKCRYHVISKYNRPRKRKYLTYLVVRRSIFCKLLIDNNILYINRTVRLYSHDDVARYIIGRNMFRTYFTAETYSTLTYIQLMK